MSENLAYLLLFLLGVFLANLPFVSNRLLGVVKVSRKGGWALVCEVLLGYGLTGLLGMYLEATVSQHSPQGWEFYAVSFCLFLVLGFPGFVYRFLWR
ncbi:DUF2818 family protein [Limnobacter sp.]|uniref:DUF2818 family protein n=1 Tax=Limnobacter sp. TaxID=2003368 RepID=UPI00258DA5A4|nr:DUF2818 family protein [Limnobacter sp.]